MSAAHKQAAHNNNRAAHDNNKEKAPSLGEVTGAGTLALGLISAWLYLVGWTYINSYLGHFSIPMLMADVSKENYLLYGGIVLEQYLAWGVAMAAIVVAAIAAWRWLRIDAGLLKIPLTILVPLGVLALLAAYWLGRQVGVVSAHGQFIQDRENDYALHPRVRVWRKEAAKDAGTPSPQGSPWASTDLPDGCYRLILHNQNRLFLVRPVKGASAADLPLVVLPWDQVEQIRVLPLDRKNCP